ncbi:MAG TPA: MaoC family dehydratase [Dehalococcoidia bacterium]|nr:MaoC family dehydratase [Dehalococcoidia bacterium]
MTQQQVSYFEDVELGDEIGPLQKVAADEGVVEFCRIWGNPMPNRFTDGEIAARARLAGPILPGVMSMAIMAQLLTQWGGPGALKDLDLVFRQPVPHNQPLNITATITDTRQEKGENLVECDILMTGAAGERYVGGTALLSLPSKSK